MKAISLPSTMRICSIGICIFIVLFLSIAMQAQTIFTVWKNGKAIGKIEAYQQETMNGRWYAIKGNMKMKAIITIHVHIQQVNFFDYNNKLMEASFTRNIDPGSAKKTSIKAAPGGYTMVDNDNKSNKVTGNIEFSTLQLYFTEPLHLKAIFSENHLQYLPLTCIGEGIYKLHQPDGYHTTYWFKHGKLQKIEGSSMFGIVQFIRS